MSAVNSTKKPSFDGSVRLDHDHRATAGDDQLGFED
jgi:hypothetical protein